MYSFLSGTFFALDDGRATIMVEGTGLGLEVFLSPLSLSTFLLGEKIALPIYHYVTDAGETLFGFVSQQEKSVFQKLLKVNGVGGKTALNILWLGVDGILRAIELQDDALLSSVPGIGKKTAQKIIVDLKGSIDFATLSENKKGWGKRIISTDTNLITSLVQMGYDKVSVEQIVESIDSSLPLEAKTVEAIRRLSK